MHNIKVEKLRSSFSPELFHLDYKIEKLNHLSKYAHNSVPLKIMVIKATHWSLVGYNLATAHKLGL